MLVALDFKQISLTHIWKKNLCKPTLLQVNIMIVKVKLHSNFERLVIKHDTFDMNFAFDTHATFSCLDAIYQSTSVIT